MDFGKNVIAKSKNEKEKRGLQKLSRPKHHNILKCQNIMKYL